MRKSSDARIRANSKYTKKAYEALNLYVNRSERINDLLAVASVRAEKSKTAYVVDAIKTQLAADGVSIADLPPAETDNTTKV